MRRLARAVLFAALASTLGRGTGWAAPGVESPRETTFVIVRHAERADNSADSPLSAAGKARATALVGVLTGAGVGAIYTTQFARTQQTAAPAALKFHLTVQKRPVTTANAATYARDLIREALEQNAGKTILIVGHSDTVPDLVRAASGRAVAAISETEFDRIFIIVRPVSGAARLIQARYGNPSAPASP